METVTLTYGEMATAKITQINDNITAMIPSAKCIYDTIYSQPEKELPHNCVNCGAVLTGDICEYCGTKY